MDKPTTVGEVLDKILSTSDADFNNEMQRIIIKYTPKGSFAPQPYVAEYLNMVHNAYFFCLENYSKPFLCIEHICELPKDGEAAMCLIDSLLFLISRIEREELQIIFIQLLNLRHELVPFDEDPEILAINENDEDYKAFVREYEGNEETKTDPPRTQDSKKKKPVKKRTLEANQVNLSYFRQQVRDKITKAFFSKREPNQKEVVKSAMVETCQSKGVSMEKLRKDINPSKQIEIFGKIYQDEKALIDNKIR